MIEPEPSDQRALERAQAYTYTTPRRFAQRVVGVFQKVTPGALGLDGSHWQLVIDFLVAKAKGILWAYLRALNGLTLDTKFSTHYPNAKGIMPRAAYLYYKDNEDPKAQAQKLYETCLQNGDIGDFMPVIDIEGKNNPTLTASKIKTCCEQIAILFGKRPLIYTGFYVWRDEVQGDKSWAVYYSLIIAAYPFVGWFPDLPQKVLDYPPMIPAPFQMWTDDPDEDMTGRAVAWQFTSYAPASEYGASGTYLDLDWSSPAFQKQVLDQQLPPPDPIPTGDYMYLADVIYLAPGTTYRNIRSKPDSTGSDAGLDVGDVVITDKGLPVYEVQTNSEGNWYMLKKGSIVGWVLGKVGTTEYLHLTPLVPMLQVTAGVDKVNMWYWKDKNGTGKPIMVQPPVPRPQFLLGARFIVDPVKVDADGEEDYYRVLNPFNATPPALVPPAGYTGWYCKVSEVF